MKSQPINNLTFGNKNTFLQKSINARKPNDARYFKSLHYEAASRLHNIRFLAAKKELKNTGLTSFSAIKTFGKMVKEKIETKLCKLKSWDELPKSFYEPKPEIKETKKHITYTKL